MSEPHRTPIRVAFDEVDMYGIVHHSKLLIYLERARISMFVDGGMTPGSLQETGFGLIVIEVGLRFRSAARFGDQLEVLTAVEKLSPVTVTLGYRVVRGTDDILVGTIRLAAVDSQGRPTRMPDRGREILEQYRPDPHIC